jgi:hypothetical protein
MLFTAGAVGRCTDAELLERFARRDGDAGPLGSRALGVRYHEGGW